MNQAFLDKMTLHAKYGTFDNSIQKEGDFDVNNHTQNAIKER
jgi:hypothetical protein